MQPIRDSYALMSFLFFALCSIVQSFQYVARKLAVKLNMHLAIWCFCSPARVRGRVRGQGGKGQWALRGCLILPLIMCGQAMVRAAYHLRSRRTSEVNHSAQKATTIICESEDKDAEQLSLGRSVRRFLVGGKCGP